MFRRPISQYSTEFIGIEIYDKGGLVDPDDETVTLDIYERDVEEPRYADLEANKDDVGLYSYQFSPEQTREIGEYKVKWKYQIDGEDRFFETEYEVVEPMPYWDMLDPNERQLVFAVYNRVANVFDSTEGGPYLFELPQNKNTHVLEVIARLMATDAMNYINFTHQPVFTPPYEVGQNVKPKWPEKLHGVLEKATYVMFLRHLSRSYIEIPRLQGLQVGTVDRTNYRQEWQREAESEEQELEKMIQLIKRKFLLSTKRSMVLGGLRFPASIPAARPAFHYQRVW